MIAIESTSATLCVIVTTFLVVSVYGSQLSLNELHFVDPTNGGASAQLQSKEHFGAVGSVFASISRKSTENDLAKTFKLLNQGVDDYAAGKKRKSLPQRLVRILAAKLGTFVPKNTNYVTSHKLVVEKVQLCTDQRPSKQDDASRFRGFVLITNSSYTLC